MKKIMLLIAGLLTVVFTAGCEGGGEGGSDAGVASGPDDINISSAVTYGTHAGIPVPSAAITRTLHSSDKSGDMVVMSFDPLNWPRDGRVDGRVYLFWESGGQVIGGMFDWHASGQTVKTLENVYGGYLGGKRPPPGTTIYFCLSNIDCSERTNVRKSNTTW